MPSFASHIIRTRRRLAPDERAATVAGRELKVQRHMLPHAHGYALTTSVPTRRRVQAPKTRAETGADHDFHCYSGGACHHVLEVVRLAQEGQCQCEALASSWSGGRH
jgi:hypothetical protein